MDNQQDDIHKQSAIIEKQALSQTDKDKLLLMGGKQGAKAMVFKAKAKNAQLN